MLFARTLLALIFNIKTLIVATLSVGSTYLCYYYDILAEFPLSLIGTAVVFPIVFSIGGAYKRREATLDDYGNIKAHGRALALLYPMPILFTVILTSLDSIQDHLENPFDQEGEDDVAINAEKFVLSLS